MSRPLTLRAARRSAVLAASVAAAFALVSPAHVAAQAAAPAAKTAKPAVRSAAEKPARPPARRPAPAPRELIVPDATQEQIQTAQLVYLGTYACEFSQTVDIALSPRHTGYVEVKHGKGQWLMKPVLSSTGAVRLEDVMDETLMVQIASKSMLLNVKTGRRVVDECVSPRQRELIEAARVEKVRAAEAAASGASGVAATAPASGNVLLR